MTPTFKAFRIYEEDGKSRGRVVQASLDELSPGAVVIRAEYSGVNYKDALAGTGSGKVVRKFPLIGGIDVSGTVESSEDARFKAGDKVLGTGFDLGVSHDGGYAQYVEDDAGRLVKMRADDGVHFERAAGDLIAAQVLERLEERFRIEG